MSDHHFTLAETDLDKIADSIDLHDLTPEDHKALLHSGIPGIRELVLSGDASRVSHELKRNIVEAMYTGSHGTVAHRARAPMPRPAGVRVRISM